MWGEFVENREDAPHLLEFQKKPLKFNTPTIILKKKTKRPRRLIEEIIERGRTNAPVVFIREIIEGGVYLECIIKGILCFEVISMQLWTSLQISYNYYFLPGPLHAHITFLDLL